MVRITVDLDTTHIRHPDLLKILNQEAHIDDTVITKEAYIKAIEFVIIKAVLENNYTIIKD